MKRLAEYSSTIGRKLWDGVSIFAWIWAIIVFIFGYYGHSYENESEATETDRNEHRNGGFKHLFIPIIKVLIIAPSIANGLILSPRSPGGHFGYRNSRTIDQSVPVQHSGSMQYMMMNPDGQYSFAYSAPESSRHERRHQDGTVEGRYSYTNPEGKVVEVQYQADARGFNTLPNPVVEDTPAVKEARDKFMEVYNRELARINGHGGVPEPVAVPLVKSDSEKKIISNSPVVVVNEDSEIVHASVDTKSVVPVVQNNVVPTSERGPGPSYFYYVGVGDMPYYVLSPVRESTNIAVSVRASQLGAIPADAVHDAQVPHYGKKQLGVQNAVPKITPPVYIEVGGDYQLPTGLPVFHQKLTSNPIKQTVLRPYYLIQ